MMSNLLTNPSSLVLWHEVIKNAEDRCSVVLKEELESYLVSLLVRYTNKPEVVNQVIATAFLDALRLRQHERQTSLQHVGDQCLLFAGLFPKVAEKRHVKINYFVDLGQAAYAAVSNQTNNIFNSLALQFVVLMDVLQSIPAQSTLLPLEAYEQWNEVGSQRALKILQEYSSAIPIKNYRA